MGKARKLPPMAMAIPEPLWRAAEEIAQEQFTTPQALIISLLLPHLTPKLQKDPTPTPKPAAIELPGDIERSSRGTGFKGVYPHGRRYRAMYMQSSLGVFDTPEEAALERYHTIRGETDDAEAERAVKQAEIDREMDEEDARNLQKWLDNTPKARIGNGPLQALPITLTPQMEARLERHIAAGRMTRPACVIARDEQKGREAPKPKSKPDDGVATEPTKRDGDAPAVDVKRPADAPPLAADPELSEIDARVRQSGLSLFDGGKK